LRTRKIQQCMKDSYWTQTATIEGVVFIYEYIKG
jgi:hypothetical protein